MDMTEFVTQTPAIGAILLIVFWNHKAGAKRDHVLKQLGENYESSRDECHKVQRDAIEVLRETSRALGENVAVQREMMTMLQRMNGKRKS